MDKQNLISRIKKGLIVSCQAELEKGSRLYEPRDIARMVQEALEFGACAVRICGIENIAETRRLNSGAIIFGIAKASYNDGRVLITPDMESIDGIVSAGADVVGMDMTERIRPSNIASLDLYKLARENFSSVLFLADVSNYEEAANAVNIGVDIVATTLSGYTHDTECHLVRHRWYEYEPDFGLVNVLARSFSSVPIIAEGRYRDPEQCYKAIELGAWAVCIGSQATRIREVVRWHVRAVKEDGFT